MLINFRCQKISFLCEQNVFIDDRHTQYNLDAKVKIFHESTLIFFIQLKSVLSPQSCLYFQGFRGSE